MLLRPALTRTYVNMHQLTALCLTMYLCHGLAGLLSCMTLVASSLAGHTWSLRACVYDDKGVLEFFHTARAEAEDAANKAVSEVKLVVKDIYKCLSWQIKKKNHYTTGERYTINQ